MRFSIEINVLLGEIVGTSGISGCGSLRLGRRRGSFEAVLRQELHEASEELQRPQECDSVCEESGETTRLNIFGVACARKITFCLSF